LPPPRASAFLEFPALHRCFLFRTCSCVEFLLSEFGKSVSFPSQPGHPLRELGTYLGNILTLFSGKQLFAEMIPSFEPSIALLHRAHFGGNYGDDDQFASFLHYVYRCRSTYSSRGALLLIRSQAITTFSVRGRILTPLMRPGMIEGFDLLACSSDPRVRAPRRSDIRCSYFPGPLISFPFPM